MTHRFHWLKGGAALLVVAAATITPISGRAATTVYVANVEELYAAVNNYPMNVGASIILAPGIYFLSSTTPAGARPHGGRLELLQDMSLYGVPGDRAAVVIDATALPRTSFTVDMPPNQRTGVIRTGRGSNAVEWLTIAGNPFAAAGVETDLLSSLKPGSESRTSLPATARAAWTSETSSQSRLAARLTPKSWTVNFSAASKVFGSPTFWAQTKATSASS